MSTVEITQQRNHAYTAANAILSAAENAKRPMTASETARFDEHMRTVRTVDEQIQTDRTATVQKMRELIKEHGSVSRADSKPGLESLQPARFSAGYPAALLDYLAARTMSASLEEGVSTAGGYVAPITVDNQIVPLAPADLAVRRLSTVIATRSDRLIPQKSSFGSAALRTEGNTFGGSVPALSQIKLSAFMCGTLALTSYEILQDVPEFEAFVLDDVSTDIQEQEEAWFLSGSGSGEAQGILGNVGSGVTEEPDGLGNLVSISGTLDLVGSLAASYYPGATWLMSRATAIGIRKAQVQTGLYEPVFTRENGQDYLHGFPVEYSAAMPAAARGAAPCLFGDFKRGYLIGDRGGSAVRLKALDQMWAIQGLVPLLCYRRTDGRVRRSEAIQQYNIAAS